MSNKNATQIVLERRVRELEKELESFRRKYKRVLKQLSKFADQDLSVMATLEAESELKFQEFHQKEEDTPKLEEESYFTVELPDGSKKRIKKKLNIE